MVPNSLYSVLNLILAQKRFQAHWIVTSEMEETETNLRHVTAEENK